MLHHLDRDQLLRVATLFLNLRAFRIRPLLETFPALSQTHLANALGPRSMMHRAPEGAYVGAVRRPGPRIEVFLAYRKAELALPRLSAPKACRGLLDGDALGALIFAPEEHRPRVEFTALQWKPAYVAKGNTLCHAPLDRCSVRRQDPRVVVVESLRSCNA